jgi:phosphomannomutase
MTNKPHTFDPSILREYDIRGTVGDTLKDIDCYNVGRAFGTILKRKELKTVVVGFDGRASSPKFSNEVIRGLNECGLDVENIGVGPTPMAYFAMKSRNIDAAVVVTGSHSPVNYNGIKMALKTGPFYGEAVQEIGRLAAAGDYEQHASGKTVTVDVQDAYVDRLVQDYTGPKNLTVAWDNGNGAAGEILRRLVKKLPGTHHVLYDEIDATFPHHHPDPTVAKNLIDLQKLVREKKCDIGIGFDGDADRVGAVDENGDILWADIIIAIYAAEVLKKFPGAPIIADVKCSRVLFDEIARLGGKPIIWNTGHSLIKAKMQETKSPLAGELAGHICFADHYYGYDDGPYCAVRLLNILSHSGKSFSSLYAHLPKIHNTPEVRFHVPADRKFKIVPEIKKRLQSANQNGVTVIDIDGVRVTTADGWWLVRASNTEDVLTVRAEGFTPDGLERLKGQMIEQLKSSGIGSPF